MAARKTAYISSVFDERFNSLRVGKISHNNEMGVYQMQNIFSYQSTWGISARRDVIDKSGTGDVGPNTNGAIEVKSGTAGSSFAVLDTARRGEYQPGKTAEGGIGMRVTSLPTLDGKIELGCFDDRNGFFFRITASGPSIVIRRAGLEIEEVPQSQWNIDKMNGAGSAEGNPSERTFDPATAYIYGVRYSYYGVGTIVFTVQLPATDGETEMEQVVLHRYVPTLFPSTTDPNKQLRVAVDNGTASENVAVDIGGRRYDIFGFFEPEARFTGEYRYKQTVTVANGMTPIIGFKKKAEFPAGRGENSVNVSVSEYSLTTTSDAVFYIMEGGNINGDWTVPRNFNNTEISVESNVNATTFSGGNPVYGPFFVNGGGNNNTSKDKVSTTNKVSVPLTNVNSMVIVAIALDTDAVITATFAVTENW